MFKSRRHPASTGQKTAPGPISTRIVSLASGSKTATHIRHPISFSLARTICHLVERTRRILPCSPRPFAFGMQWIMLSLTLLKVCSLVSSSNQQSMRPFTSRMQPIHKRSQNPTKSPFSTPVWRFTHQQTIGSSQRLLNAWATSWCRICASKMRHGMWNLGRVMMNRTIHCIDAAVACICCNWLRSRRLVTLIEIWHPAKLLHHLVNMPGSLLLCSVSCCRSCLLVRLLRIAARRICVIVVFNIKNSSTRWGGHKYYSACSEHMHNTNTLMRI